MGTSEKALTRAVAEKIGHYVYIYIDPRTDEIFYVGKGTGARALFHLLDDKVSSKTNRIRELYDLGIEPRIEIVAHGLENDETAFRIEAALIDTLGIERLTNEVRGWQSIQYGRINIQELINLYDPEEVEIKHPSLIIRINKLYKKGITQEELFDATRGIWRLGTRRNNVKYALATFYGIVREVYEVDAWFPAGTSEYSTRLLKYDSKSPRWEFSGSIAPTDIRNLYINKSVGSYLKNGQQSPTLYVNC